MSLYENFQNKTMVEGLEKFGISLILGTEFRFWRIRNKSTKKCPVLIFCILRHYETLGQNSKNSGTRADKNLTHADT